jgi:hydrogenase maturation factor
MTMNHQTSVDRLQQTNSLLAAGKLPPNLLDGLLHALPTDDPQLILGPSVGEDAAVIDFAPGQERLLVAKSDPVTFATDAIGHYAVNVCANDLAVTGATPRFYMPTLLLPAEQADAAMARRIFEQLGQACRQLGVSIAGGHSEITHAVSQPVVAGTMLGEVPRDRFVRSGGCQAGDAVLLVGEIPVEGVSLIAREKRDILLERGWNGAEVATAADYLYNPGISVLTPALLAAATGLVTAMHDPTEGGVASGLLELAFAAGLGLRVDLDAIPVPDLAQRLCAEFGLDPLGTIASGALLATARPEHAEVLMGEWAAAGYEATVIGRIEPASQGVSAHRGGEPYPFPRFVVDEITKLFA